MRAAKLSVYYTSQGDYYTRQDKTRQDKTRQDKTRQDKTRHNTHDTQDTLDIRHKTQNTSEQE